MPNNSFLAWLPVTFCALTSVSFSASVNADYYHYQQSAPATYQNVSFRNASLQSQMQWEERVFTPPVIMPYVPFDDEVDLMVPQQLNHYQPPANHYQPQARTWRQQQPANRAPMHLSAARQKILQIANRQMGIRYRWGGNTPRQGFDCSGFTKYAMRGSNITIPRTAAEQSRASHTISRGQLRPGDMIFFKTKGRRVNHVGIYLGNGRFIHAASGGGKVMTDDLRKSYWQKRLHKYGTFLS
ncbi:MAG: C40 family peptidase [Thiolinea sp.]